MRLSGRGRTGGSKGSVTNVTSRRPRSGRFRALAGLAVLVVLAGPLALILVFRFLPPPVTPLMLIRLAEGHPRHQQWVSYREDLARADGCGHRFRGQPFLRRDIGF